MAGSGLAEAHKTCYGEDTVKHIAAGKAVAKSIRANLLAEAAVTTTILSGLIPTCVNVELEQNKESSETENLAPVEADEVDLDDTSSEKIQDWISYFVSDESNSLRKLTADETDAIMDLSDVLEQDYDKGLDVLET
jgi:hypothetical protein